MLLDIDCVKTQRFFNVEKTGKTKLFWGKKHCFLWIWGCYNVDFRTQCKITLCRGWLNSLPHSIQAWHLRDLLERLLSVDSEKALPLASLSSFQRHFGSFQHSFTVFLRCFGLFASTSVDVVSTSARRSHNVSIFGLSTLIQRLHASKFMKLKFSPAECMKLIYRDCKQTQPVNPDEVVIANFYKFDRFYWINCSWHAVDADVKRGMVVLL